MKTKEKLLKEIQELLKAKNSDPYYLGYLAALEHVLAWVIKVS